MEGEPQFHSEFKLSTKAMQTDNVRHNGALNQGLTLSKIKQLFPHRSLSYASNSRNKIKGFLPFEGPSTSLSGLVVVIICVQSSGKAEV